MERLLAGEAMAIDGCPVRLIWADSDPEHLPVYVDLGVPSAPAAAYERMLKLNFEFGSGQRGVLSLHPTNGHALYAFRYPLVEASTGKGLLDWVLRFISGRTADEVLAGQPAKEKRS